MDRPELKEETSDGVIAFVGELLDYCDILEETISALRDDYAEQVKVTAELRRRITECDYYNDLDPSVDNSRYAWSEEQQRYVYTKRNTGMSEQYKKNYGENPNGKAKQNL